MLTLMEVLQRTQRYLTERGVPNPRRDAEMLLSHVVGLERLQLYVQFERPMIKAELDQLRPVLARRGRREPLAWVLGQTGFHNIELVVHPHVLVPRPDTETLVEAALALIPPDEAFFIADVGTGTGAVALAIAAARPAVRVYAIDPSEDALRCARANVDALGMTDRVALLRGTYLDPIPAHRSLDLVISNPPYIPTAELATLEAEVRDHEPRLALDGGPDGLTCYRQLLPAAARRARVGVLVELGHDQAAAVSTLAQQAGLGAIRIHKDLGGHDRVLEGLSSS